MNNILSISVILIIQVLHLSVFGHTTNQNKTFKTKPLLSENSFSGGFYERTDSSVSFTDTINFMGHWYGEDKRENFVREWVQDYQNENPDVYVNLKFSNEIMGEKSKFKTAWFISEMIMFNNYTWDIVWLDDNIFQIVTEQLADNNWGKKYLVDFSEYPEFIEGHKSEIIIDSRYKNLTGGQLVGPMIEGYYVLLWYNEPLADKIGLNIKSRGMSYEDFLTYIKEIYSFNMEHNTSYAALYESYDWRTTGQYLFQQLFNSAVSEEKKSTTQKSEQEIKDLALLKTLQAFEELGKYDPLITTYNKSQWFDTRDYVLNDSCVFYLGGSWMYSHWNSLDSIKMKKMKAAELPVFYSLDSYLGGYIPTWSVMKNSSNRERAIDFLLFLCQPKYADKWIQYAHSPTGLKVSTDSNREISNENEEINEYVERVYGRNIKFSADTKYVFRDEQNVTQNTFYEILIKILTGKISAKEAYDDFKEMDEF